MLLRELSEAIGVSGQEDAIRKLIETPTGQRPFRTEVGSDARDLSTYNALADEIRVKNAHELKVSELLGTEPRATASGAHQ